MKDCFETEFKIGYSNINDLMTLRLSNLIGFLQNSAIEHSNSIGLSMPWFNENNKSWVLTSWKVLINYLPTEGETLHIKTWSTPYKRIQAKRDFQVYDSSGNEVCYATSKWILIDTIKRRPLKVESGFFSRYEFENKKEFRTLPEASVDFSNLDSISSRTIKITRRETDFNNHANNVAYVDWAMDDIPKEIYEHYKIQETQILYKKECYLDSSIISRCYLKNLPNGFKEVISVFSSESDDNLVHGQVSTIWQKPL